MGKTNVIIYVEEQRNLPSCLWSIRNFTNKDTYDVSLVSRKPLDSVDDMVADVYIRENPVHAINEAISSRKSERIVFLFADVMVTPHWLDKLTVLLGADKSCAAAGPVGYHVEPQQRIGAVKSYANIEEMLALAAEYAETNRGQAAYSLYLDAFCILMRRHTILDMGGLDEGYDTPAQAFKAMTLFLVRDGKSCLVARDVWLHNARPTYSTITEGDRHYFKETMGIDPMYSLGVRYDLLSLMDAKKENLCLMEIGCACGGTLLQIKSHNPSAEIYGVELSESAAAVAKNFGTVLQQDMLLIKDEKYNNKFDYILMGDVLEHIVDTDGALDKVYGWLKKGGQLLVSVPNISNITVLSELMLGQFTYRDSGILDRTHMRFFTFKEMKTLLEHHGFKVQNQRHTKYDYGLSELEKELLSLKSLHINPVDLEAYQWIFVAEK